MERWVSVIFFPGHDGWLFVCMRTCFPLMVGLVPFLMPARWKIKPLLTLPLKLCEIEISFDRLRRMRVLLSVIVIMS